MAGFDIITPVWGAIENIAYGPHHTFVIPEGYGPSGAEITGKIHHEKIKTWFHNNTGGYITFNTRKADAPRAQEIIEVWFKIQTASPAPKGSGAKAGKDKGKQPYQPGAGWRLFE